MSSEENKTYIVAGIHPKNGTIKLDTGKRYRLAQAEDRARYFNNTYAIEKSVLGITNFVAFNMTALNMNPPYSIDMEAEWNYVVEQEGHTPSVEINRQIGGSI
tara:strand:+ start:2060 stop:2368 length:309 start_codon:yes stop_codon:yes gene_type:complete